MILPLLSYHPWIKNPQINLIRVKRNYLSFHSFFCAGLYSGFVSNLCKAQSLTPLCWQQEGTPLCQRLTFIVHFRISGQREAQVVGIFAKILIIGSPTLLISMPTLTLFFLKKTNSSTKDGPNQHLLVKLIRLQLKEAIPQKTSFLLGITQIPPLPTAPFSLFRDEKMSLFAWFKTEWKLFW